MNESSTPNAGELSGPEFGPAAGGAPEQIVVLLHGWGADGNDLIGLAPVWSQVLPNALFVSPHGPQVCDVGMGRQWFSLDDRRPEALLAGAQAAAPMIDRFIDAGLARQGLDDKHLAIVGFSQGTMMALFTAARRGAACAGIAGYSGALIGGDLLAAETRARPPVMLVHGEADPIIAATAMTNAAEGLTAAGFQVETHLRPGLGHGIDEEGFVLGARFLASAFGLQAPKESRPGA